jgi:hypothetical protein
MSSDPTTPADQSSSIDQSRPVEQSARRGNSRFWGGAVALVIGAGLVAVAWFVTDRYGVRFLAMSPSRLPR